MAEGRIIESVEWGEHIPLTCRNHSNLRWSTKNIAPIGARSLFFKGDNEGRNPLGAVSFLAILATIHKAKDRAEFVNEFVPECPCAMSDLYPLADDEREMK